MYFTIYVEMLHLQGIISLSKSLNINGKKKKSEMCSSG